jgi:hypothetical protein
LTLGSKQLMPSTRLNVLMEMELFSRCSNAWGLAMARQHVRKAQEASEMTIPIRLAEQFFWGGGYMRSESGTGLV